MTDVEVSGIPIHPVGNRPSGIVEERERTVEIGLLISARDANGVILLNGWSEEELKPVGIALSGFLKEAQLSIHSIGKSEGLFFRIPLIDQVTHNEELTSIAGASCP